MRWTVPELFFDLKQDPARRILFVEGVRDVQFWDHLIPEEDRGDTVIYSMAAIDCAPVEHGERGRLVWCAENFFGSNHSDRALFFADADTDRVLEVKNTENIVLTDGRDLEGYCMTPKCLKRISQAFGKSDAFSSSLLIWAKDIARPIGILRICDRRLGWKLPFQRTFDHGIACVLDGKLIKATFNSAKLVTQLLQKGKMDASRGQEISAAWKDETKRLEKIEDFQIIHGKDFTRAVAFALQAEEEKLSRLIFLPLNPIELFKFPSIKQVRAWVSGENAVIELAEVADIPLEGDGWLCKAKALCRKLFLTSNMPPTI